MIWAIADPLRFAAEQRGVAALEVAESWLTVIGWRAVSGDLVVEFDIDLGGRVFDGRLTYPQSFPQVPPALTPREQRRWSGHQYGAGGELCLEWGPDNWAPDVTGADMIASAWRLLSGEEAEGDPVHTRHALTPGQELRGETRRFVATEALCCRLTKSTHDQEATFGLCVRDAAWLVVLATLDGEDEWADASVPASVLDAGSQIPGHVVLVDRRPEKLTGKASDLRSRLVGVSPPDGLDFEVLLFRSPEGQLWASFLGHSTDIAVELAVVSAEPSRRLGSEHDELTGKSVAVVGCGSLGAKIAASLARSGVGKFVLVDDDVLRPGNLVRHELDWMSVGRHKADALAERLRLLNACVKVDVRRHRLGGQESNGALDGAVSRLARCDLIVDATADSHAFNYAAAAAAEGRGAMIWAEVFGGGFGGLVARSLPALDPPPQMARALIEAWCRDHGIATPRVERDYEASSATATLVADDAAVSTVAAHATAMALDALIGRSPSRFPYSAYMIGMMGEWIFTEPFDTRPIDLGGPAAEVSRPALEDPQVVQALAALAEVVRR